MYLDEYLFRTKITQKFMAKTIAMPQNRLSKIQTGKARPTIVNALKIERFCDGKVTWQEVFQFFIDKQGKEKIMAEKELPFKEEME